MAELRVALLQMRAAENSLDIEANARRAEDFCRRAKVLGSDLALFPEMFSVGSALPRAGEVDRTAWQQAAQSVDGPYVARFRSLARELEMSIAATYLESNDPQPRDSIVLIDRRGTVVLNYAKVHLCEFDAEASLSPGSSFDVAELETSVGVVRVGAMICYDREFPESARLLMLAGAELILVPNACEMELNRSAQLRARAFENMVAVALANYAGPPCLGRSMAFDGVAFSEPEGPSRDMLIAEGGNEEEIVIASIDLDRLRRYRNTETWGNAYRRPRLYGALTSEDVHEPFSRSDAKR